MGLLLQSMGEARSVLNKFQIDVLKLFLFFVLVCLYREQLGYLINITIVTATVLLIIEISKRGVERKWTKIY